MSFFNDDPFDNIVREFFGESLNQTNGSRDIIRGEEDERTIDFVQAKDKVFLVFELPGYSGEDVIVNVKKGEIEIIVKKKSTEGIQQYLVQKLKMGKSINRTLPNFVNYKKFNYTFKNGILEVVFNRK